MVDVHVVFSAECIPAFDWQSAGLFYSFNRTRQPGKITRLLACSDEQLASYPKSNLDMGPTFVHLNMRFDAVNDIERGDPFHDDKAGHGCPPPPSNSKAFFPVPHMRSAAAAQTPATTSHSLSWRGLSRSTLRTTRSTVRRPSRPPTPVKAALRACPTTGCTQFAAPAGNSSM